MSSKYPRANYVALLGIKAVMVKWQDLNLTDDLALEEIEKIMTTRDHLNTTIEAQTTVGMACVKCNKPVSEEEMRVRYNELLARGIVAVMVPMCQECRDA